jgi:hypothetical protein
LRRAFLASVLSTFFAHSCGSKSLTAQFRQCFARLNTFKNAKECYASGKFLLERLGADRYLDLPLFATLAQLREGLLRGIENPTTGYQMLADTTVIAYHNILKTQGWIGSTSLVVSGELFGQEPLVEAYGTFEADRIEKKVERLETTIMLLLDHAQRMLIRAVDRLTRVAMACLHEVYR